MILVLEDRISHNNSKSAVEQIDLKPRIQIPAINLVCHRSHSMSNSMNKFDTQNTFQSNFVLSSAQSPWTCLLPRNLCCESQLQWYMSKQNVHMYSSVSLLVHVKSVFQQNYLDSYSFHCFKSNHQIIYFLSKSMPPLEKLPKHFYLKGSLQTYSCNPSLELAAAAIPISHSFTPLHTKSLVLVMLNAIYYTPWEYMAYWELAHILHSQKRPFSHCPG